ncbi:MAG: GNAT family N-acetyltransferase [Steroidobacteraceae bacterium]|jgi:ribosomal protein S18 acetylase RimI-like enzyme|nr:GNAT family N-acetyltransferase [Steroidobacteraceae bacterium]
MGDWAIRRAEADDADRLALVGAATFLETFAGVLEGSAIVQHCARRHSVEAYAAFLADAGTRAWLAEASIGRAPVGYALLARPDLPGAAPGQGDVELQRIYLLSRYHGQGLGAALMACAVDAARELRARRLMLGVFSGNERAIGFYRRQGFTDVGVRRFRVGDREYDDVVLARDVA